MAIEEELSAARAVLAQATAAYFEIDEAVMANDGPVDPLDKQLRQVAHDELLAATSRVKTLEKEQFYSIVEPLEDRSES